MINDEEQKALKQTVDLWTTVVNLPVQHQDDMNEFRFHIHAIQRIISMRSVRRDNPDQFRGGHIQKTQ